MRLRIKEDDGIGKLVLPTYFSLALIMLIFYGVVDGSLFALIFCPIMMVTFAFCYFLSYVEKVRK